MLESVRNFFSFLNQHADLLSCNLFLFVDDINLKDFGLCLMFRPRKSFNTSFHYANCILNTLLYRDIKLPAKLLDYFLRSNKSNISQVDVDF